MEYLQSLAGDNPYFSAGFGLMGIGAGLSIARRGILRLSHFAQRQMLCDLEIASKDASYDWFLEWMAKQPKRSSRNFAVETQHTKHANGSITASFGLVPGPGTHLVQWDGAYILVKRERSQRLMDITHGRPFETLQLKTLYMHRHVFSEMLAAAQSGAARQQEGKLVVYTSFGSEWRPFGQPRHKRSLESVVLAPQIKEDLVVDLEKFIKTRDWYADRGVPYRRGYLLYGPPGSGKTSFIQAIAGHLNYNLCILNLAELTLTDDRLNHLMNSIPPRSILVLEDIDSAFDEKRKKSNDFGTGVTFSGLLNALDGVTSAEERIIFMTTNHPERLDPALVRPGRIDYKALLDNVTPEQARAMFLRFYPGEEDLATKFVEHAIALQQPISAAQLQGLFVFSKDDPKRTVELLSS